MIRSFIERSIAERPVYVTPEIEVEYTAGYERHPEGLAFRLIPEGSGYTARKMPEFTIRTFERRGRLEDMVWQLYAGAFASLGEECRKNGDLLMAREAFDRASRLRGRDARGFSPGSRP
jgi:hypothetical protein